MTATPTTAPTVTHNQERLPVILDGSGLPRPGSHPRPPFQSLSSEPPSPVVPVTRRPRRDSFRGIGQGVPSRVDPHPRDGDGRRRAHPDRDRNVARGAQVGRDRDGRVHESLRTGYHHGRLGQTPPCALLAARTRT
jgi:hypothetical protein